MKNISLNLEAFHLIYNNIKLPGISISQIIGRRAEVVFEYFLPPSWITNRVHSDFGIDYSIQPSINNLLAVSEFLVQLKGSSDITVLQDGRMSVSVKVSSLNYWLLRELPIMIVAVDEHEFMNENIYGSWLEVAYDKYPDLVEGVQENITIHISKDMDLKLPETHKAIIEYLEKRTHNRHLIETTKSQISKIAHLPKILIDELFAKLPDVVALKKLIEIVDERFDVELTVGKETMMTFRSKSKAPIIIATLKTPKDETTSAKLKSLLEYGETVSFTTDEIEMFEPEIVKFFFPNTINETISISPHIPKEPVPVLLEVGGLEGNKYLSNVMNISLEKLGLRRIRLRLWNKNMPVTFFIDFESEDSGVVDYSMDFTSCSLESAKKGMELMKVIESGSTIVVKTTHDDKILIEMDTRKVKGKYNYDKSIKLIEALIKINATFGYALKYPETLDADSIYNIQVAYFAAENGYCEFPIDGDMEISYSKEGIEIISRFDWDNPETKLEFKADTYPLMIFGEQINLGPSKGEIFGVRPSITNEELMNIAATMENGQNTTVRFVQRTVESIIIKYIFRSE